jgi:hypothetical protein
MTPPTAAIAPDHCTDSPFDQVLGASQSMSANGTLPNDLPIGTVSAQVVNITGGC